MTYSIRLCVLGALILAGVLWWFNQTTPTTAQVNNIIQLHKEGKA